MHAETDSEVTSLSASTRRPLYYVQSPLGDFHDGDKILTTASFPSSPLASPHHSYSIPLHHHKDYKEPWNQIDLIDESFLEDEDPHNNALPRRCYFLAFVVEFLLLFTLFSLILLGVSKAMKPKIFVKSIMFDEVRVQAGADASGVTTDMITLNSTLKFTYHNIGTFFGVQVSATPLNLSYSEIVIASGDMEEFHQSRTSERLVSVAVIGKTIPLYGSGASLSSTTGMATVPVHLKLNFVLRSRAYVLGKLVEPKFYKRVECSITLYPNKIGASIPLNKSCTYD
ncbi:hypothetical protein TanjilG_06109 [Lupinus angustifolius]|uniref:Late embryogenesis abundant protein LEA-2 subgroup domain-containing protein n=1 Tax=Lupinus angustifolius TaxID=3871 RepID=A0A1J7GSS4_LUPAN|nr:PREDICTED: uncharacterized protein LOC109358119 [Lupinus angustifolius]OIW03600.1 hypothetical protein TanjilG_06109 [Lupinus angustifolius]